MDIDDVKSLREETVAIFDTVCDFAANAEIFKQELCIEELMREVQRQILAEFDNIIDPTNLYNRQSLAEDQ